MTQDTLIIVTGMPVLLASMAVVFWPELRLIWYMIRRLGEEIGWVFYRAAMRRMERDRQREALHAIILYSYVKSGDSYGMAQYLDHAASRADVPYDAGRTTRRMYYGW